MDFASDTTDGASPQEIYRSTDDQTSADVAECGCGRRKSLPGSNRMTLNNLLFKVLEYA